MQVRYTKYANKFINKLTKSNPDAAENIVAKVETLKIDPEPPDSLKLKGYREEYLRVRSGDFRAIYFIAGDLVSIVHIGHRGTVYQEFKRRFG